VSKEKCGICGSENIKIEVEYGGFKIVSCQDCNDELEKLKREIVERN